MSDNTFSLAELMIVAAAEAWRDDGELLASGLGIIPRLGASLAKQGVEAASPRTPAQFAAMVQADSARWAQVIKENKITLD